VTKSNTRTLGSAPGRGRGSQVGFKHVLFDVDGTLIDSRAAIVAAYRHAFRVVVGVEYPQTEAEIRALLAPRLREVCQAFAGSRATACEEAYRRFYLEATDGLVTAMPGVAETLAGLMARGLGIGLVTNKGRERLATDLERTGLAGIDLEPIVTAEDSAERKPDPRPIVIALERAGIGASQAVYVGDGPHDVAATAAVGVASVGATYGYYGRDLLAAAGAGALIEAPGELLELLDSGTALPGARPAAPHG